MSDRARRSSNRRRYLRWGITFVVLGFVGFFFAQSLSTNWADLSKENLRFSWWWVAATVILALAVPLTGLCWARIVRVLAPDAKFSLAEAIRVQCASWLLKYIPGQVGSVVNKVVWGRDKGISRILIVITFIYENVFLQIVSIVPSVIILLLSLGPGIFGENITLLVVPVIVLVPLVLIMWKKSFHAVVEFPARKILKQSVPSTYFFGTGQTLRSLVEFCGPRLLNGVGFVIIAATVTDVAPTEWLPLAAAYILAGAVGILAVFVPSGLGVREAVIVLILSQYMSTPAAIVISLLARLLSTIGDGVVALLYVSLRRTSSTRGNL